MPYLNPVNHWGKTLDSHGRFLFLRAMDDGREHCETICRVLEQGDFQAVTVGDPQEFIDQLLRHDFDLLFIDATLNRRTLQDLVSRVRVLGYSRGIIIIGDDTSQRLEDKLVTEIDDWLVPDRLNSTLIGNRIRRLLDLGKVKEHLAVFRSLAEISNDALVVGQIHANERHFEIVFTNAMFRNVTGFPRTGDSSFCFSQLFQDGLESETFQNLCEAVVREGYRSTSVLLRRSDGEKFHAELVVKAVSIGSRQSDLFLASIRDVEHRRMTELECSRQARMLDLARDAIVAQDLEGKVSFWNEGAHVTFGVSGEKAVGCDFSSIFGLPGEVVASARSDTLENGRWHGQLDLVTASGEIMTLDSSWTLMHDDDGDAFSILTISRDVTERRRMDEKLNRSERLEAVGALAIGIAHDLNNILTPITLGASVLDKERDLPAHLEELSQAIRSSTKRGVQLIQQLLKFGKGSGGNHTALQVEDIVDELLALVASTFPKNISVHQDLGDGLWAIHGDPVQVQQVLLNLTLNGRDAMPNGGLLNLSAENVEVDNAMAATIKDGRPGRFVRISVRDTGSGIPDDIRDRIFDRFFTTKSAARGNGLGLGTVLRIIAAHYGMLKVQSVVNEGSCFEVFLPAANSPCRPLGPRARHRAQRGKSEVVLIVDDEDFICQILSRMLNEFGYRTLTARDGKQGMKIFALHRDEIKLVISDILMPEMDGPTMINEMRQGYPELPVIFCSGASGPNELQSTQTSWEEIGRYEVLRKPVTLEEVLEKVSTEIKRAHGGSSVARPGAETETRE